MTAAISLSKSVLSLSLISVFVLTGCEETKSTDWFKEHPQEMQKVYEACMSSGEDSQNCRNAKEVHLLIQQKNAPIPTYK